MKILCCFSKFNFGNIKNGYSYEYLNYFLSLKALHPSTEIFDTSIIFGNNNYDITSELIKRVKETQPKIIFFCIYKYEYDAKKIEKLKKNSVTIVIFMDDNWRLKHSYYWAKYVSYVTTTDFFGVKRFASKKINNAIYFPFGVNTNIYLHEKNIEKKFDISFIGSWHPYREWILNILIKKGFNVFIAGPNWDRSQISFDEMIRIINQSQINLNLSNSTQWELNYLFSSWNSFKNSIVSPKSKEQLKARIFEIGSTKNFVISYFFNQHKFYFDTEYELIEFKEIHDLLNKCRFFLDNPILRNKISEKLQKKIHNKYDYKNMFNQLIDKIS